ncbi:MAG: ABC transporter substrate-binding protein [Chromatiales bacterium]|nr:ABC transporter substrate-binding protein [Chromatiales bacterium]
MWNSPYPSADADKSIYYSAFTERPKHLDPVRAYSEDEYAFIAQIYEPPLQYHFLKRPYELAPLAATEVPKAHYFDAEGNSLPDDAAIGQIAFSEYDIKLKPGITYQPHPALAVDGEGNYLYHQLDSEALADINILQDFSETGFREVVAEDYAYQIKRLAFPKLLSPIAGTMADYIVGFKSLGKTLTQDYAKLKKEIGRDEPYFDLRQYDLEGVQVIDKYTLRIRLKGKYPQFLYWLAMPFFAPMPWEAEAFYSQPGMKERNLILDWYPIGSGPFMLAENNPNLRMVLERNPNFHGETYPTEGEKSDRAQGLLDDAGRTLPLIDKAIYSLDKESIPRWNKFLQGYYDVSGISSDSFDQAIEFGVGGRADLTESMKQKEIDLLTAVETSIFYMGFNMSDPVIGGDSERARLLRQAISIAIDFEEYISIFLNGRGIAAQGPIPPGIYGNREGVEGINSYVYDVVDGKAKRKSIDYAKKLMEQAGYPNGRDRKTGKPLILYYDTTALGPGAKANLNWIKKQYQKLGIQLVIRATDYNRFQEKTRKGTAQIFMWGWNADYPDPENFFFLLYGPNGKVEHSGANATNYKNAEFDRLFRQMKNMDNSPERQRIIDRMVEILRHDAPWVWGFHPKAFSLLHSWYKNAKPNLMANNTLKYKRVDPVLRQQQRKLWNPPVTWPLIAIGLLLIAIVAPAVVMYRQHERSTAR